MSSVSCFRGDEAAVRQDEDHALQDPAPPGITCCRGRSDVGRVRGNTVAGPYSLPVLIPVSGVVISSISVFVARGIRITMDVRLRRKTETRVHRQTVTSLTGRRLGNCTALQSRLSPSVRRNVRDVIAARDGEDTVSVAIGLQPDGQPATLEGTPEHRQQEWVTWHG